MFFQQACPRGEEEIQTLLFALLNKAEVLCVYIYIYIQYFTIHNSECDERRTGIGKGWTEHLAYLS